MNPDYLLNLEFWVWNTSPQQNFICEIFVLLMSLSYEYKLKNRGSSKDQILLPNISFQIETIISGCNIQFANESLNNLTTNCKYKLLTLHEEIFLTLRVQNATVNEKSLKISESMKNISSYKNKELTTLIQSAVNVL